MTLDELEEALDELLPGGYILEEDNHGQLVVYTCLCQDEDGDLHPCDTEEIDMDPDLAPLEEDEDED
jgi:hypothetical protein